MKKLIVCFLVCFSSLLIQSSDRTIPIEHIGTLQYAATRAIHKQLQEQADQAFAILEKEKNNNNKLLRYKNNDVELQKILADQEKNLAEFELIAQNYTNFNDHPLLPYQRLSLFDKKNKQNKSLLDLVIQNDDQNIMKILLDHGVNIFVCDQNNNNYFHDLAKNNSHKVALLMLNYQPNDSDPQQLEQLKQTKKLAVNMYNKYGNTPLHIAATFHAADIIPLFAQAQAHGFLQDDNGSTALSKALVKYDLNTVLKILQSLYQGDNHDLNSFKSNGDAHSYLYLITSWSDDEDVMPVLQQILPKIADINYQNKSGNTALHQSIMDKDNVLKLLLQYNPNLNIANNAEQTPLMFSLESDHDLCFKTLLDAGADYNVRYRASQNTLLHVAAIQNHQTHAQHLLTKDPILVNLLNNDLRTPLHLAIMHRYNQMALLLARHGASLDAKDKDNKTPLKYLDSQEWPMYQPSQSSQDFYYDNEDMIRQLKHAHKKYKESQLPILEKIKKIRDRKNR